MQYILIKFKIYWNKFGDERGTNDVSDRARGEAELSGQQIDWSIERDGDSYQYWDDHCGDHVSHRALPSGGQLGLLLARQKSQRN